MKWFRYIGFIIISLGLGACSTWHSANDAWVGPDKVKHFAVSAGLSAAAAQSLHGNHMPPSHRATAAIGFSVSMGLGKELYDARAQGSGFSWKDLAYDVGGAIAGYQLYRLAH
ncbi:MULTISPECIES: YfiM family protein [Vitreoscilla]|uniref:DUF2279 domain-containing protein n=1 Tax=Vitreoscilla stercoraria TaxID=61 RepID=A0ABY4EDX4_VITST|nr:MULTISPECIES: DUF2279 domain-containing protein [Vitreoscilla]AUZ05167.1 putative lipoprotein [Vitreoscilla sp. C1]UOO93486.1 DUF2279 domain-containing protein [Vitreoscilla stercoraria]